MAKIRRVIRKIQPAYTAALDEQLWPINVMLLVLGGMLSGELVTWGILSGNLHSGSPLHNTWMHIAVTWLLIGGSMLMAWKVGGVMARRTQLSLVLALILFLILITCCIFVEVFAEIRVDDEIRDVAQRPEVPLPESLTVQVEEQPLRYEFERPVETEEPEPEPDKREEITPETEPPKPKPQDPEEQPLPKPEQQERPNPVERPEQRQTPPRRADNPSLLSRQPLPVHAPSTQVASPNDAKQSQPRPSSPVDAQERAVAQRRTESSTQLPTPRETPQTETQQPRIQTAQRQSPAAAPQQTATRPTLRREVRQPTQVPRVQVAATTAAEANQNSPETQPDATANVQRRQVATPTSQPQPTPQPEEQAASQPNTQVVRQNSPQQPQTLPQQAERPVTRQRRPSPAQVADVTAPQVPQPSEQPSDQPSAQVASQTDKVSRQSAPSTDRPSPAAATEAEAAQSDIEPATRQLAEASTPSQTATSAPSATRNVRESIQIAAAASALAEQAAEAPSPTSSPSAAVAENSVQRNTAASPQVANQPAKTSLAEVTARAESSLTRANPSPRAETLARSSMNSPTRTIQQAATPTTTSVVATATAASPSPAANPTLQPRQVSVSRQALAQSTAAQPNIAATSATQTNTPNASTAVATRPRSAPVSSQPSALPFNDATAATRRASQTAAVASSPVSVPSPASVESSEPNLAASQPRTTSLSRSRRGTAGVGQQRNHDRGEAGPRTVSDVASSSARRSEATSQQPDPAALATSSRARVAKGRTMAEAPTSTLLAQAEDAAIATGVAAPSDIEATASAAQRDAAAAETESTVTADAGSTDFDTGPTQLASEFNTGRAAGGGEPELHQATQSPRASRLAAAGGAQVAAINAEVVAAEVAEAETADGGGQPDMAAAETEVATVSRTADSATAAAEQTEVAAETTAASELIGGAPQLAAARAPRSTAAVAFSGAAAGGGTTQPLRQPSVNFTANTRADAPSPETAIKGAGNTTPESAQVAAGPVARQQPRQGANAGASPQSTADVADASGADAATASTQVAAAAARERAAAAQARSSASARAARAPRAAGAALAAASTQVQIPASSTGESGSPSDSAAATSEGVVAKITRARRSAAADGGAAAPAAVAAAVGATTAAANSGAASPASAARGRPTPDAVAFAAASAGTSAGPARPLRTVVASGGPSVPIAVPSAVVGAVGDQGESAPVEAEKTGVARTNGRLGVEGAPVSQPTGAAEGEVAVDAKNFAASGLQPGARPEAEAGGQPGPDGARAGGGAPFKISRQAAIPGVTRIVIEEDDVASGGPEFTTGDPPMQFGGGEGAVARRETGGAQSLVGGRPGDGGLGDQPAAEAGSTSRKSQTQSDVVALATDVRFQQRDIGGPKFSGNTQARDTGGAFEGRKRRFGVDGHLGSVPNVGPEIMSGLEFLRRHQSDDGSWSFNNLGGGRDGYANERAAIRSDTAATGLCLMCYLGAGYDHFDFGGEYTQEIQGALKWLLDHQGEDGNLYVDLDPQSSASAALYSHAIATMALCEAYGMTKDPKIKAAAQKAIEFIEATQHPDRGGWRYVPGKSSDLSVTGWMIGASKSGELAGLKVKAETYKKAFGYLERCVDQKGRGALYVYNPNAPLDQRQGRLASRSMTAVGLLLRLYEGWNRDRSEMKRGADYLLEQMPSSTDSTVRDTYYWYYATQVMFHMGGDVWERWERQLHEVLRRTQEKSGRFAGSWNPLAPVEDRYGKHGGRIYVTAMNLLSLEVDYRYLPLYQETGK